MGALSLSLPCLATVGYTMGNMACRHMLGSGFTMSLLVIKEDIRTESTQKVALWQSPQKQTFIKSNVPLS